MPDFFKIFLLGMTLLGAGFFSSAVPALAGEIKFFLREADFLFDEFKVEVILDSEEPVNALEGELVFLGGYASLEAVSDGNSVINFWIKRPQTTAGNILEFAGIIPGGFKGGQGGLFTMVFKSKDRLNPGDKIPGFIIAQKVRGFLNDGRSSVAKLVFLPFDLVVPLAVATTESGGQTKPKDSDPPENFQPEIVSEPLVFAGKYFLVFGTQDKDSGVNYYEVKEGGRSFRRVESPYLLENQLLTEWILVRAVDNAGNRREVEVSPKRYGAPFKTGSVQLIILISLVIFVIFISVLAILGHLSFKYARKHSKH